MKAFQAPLAFFFIFLSCIVLTEGQIGRWTKCVGFPPTDSFKAPDGKIVAWSPEDRRLGRADSRTSSNPGCFAYFAKFREVKRDKSNSFFVLRKLQGGLSENGKDYKWVSYRDYIYGYKTCEPVKYDQTLPFVPSFLKQARLRNCASRWINLDILAFCNVDDGKCWPTLCNNEFEQSSNFAMTNAYVLCMSSVARREMMITRVDLLTASNVKTKPWMVLQDKTQNGGTTTVKWKFSKTWTKKTSSTYSKEHGWRLKVSTTYSSGILNDAIAKWQVNVEAEGHGTYVTTNTNEETVGNVYERNFDVPPKSFYSVTVTIFKQEITVPYVAKEKFFDAKGVLLGQNELRGTWKGVSTFAGTAKVLQRPLTKEELNQDKTQSGSGSEQLSF